ncbi:MAG: HD-GYP domain-containing protein [Mariprofundaceae bacterium]
MSKYIDLLRAHRKEEEKQKPATSGEAPQADQGMSDLEGMLQDEQPGSTTAAGAPAPQNQLPDEAEAIAEDYTSPAASAPNSKGNAETGEIAAWLTTCTQHILSLFNAAASDTSFDIGVLEKHIGQLTDRLQDKPEAMNELELEIANRTKNIRAIDAVNGDLVQKAVMMMLYAIKTGLQLNIAAAELKLLTLAAMLHHIGMAQIPADIRQKKEQLNKEERELIRQASKKAHDYLHRCGISTPQILLAAEQTQERYDGSGPKGLSGTDIAYSARIVGLLSMFESLIHYRPYRERLLPRDAIRELVNHHKAAFDPVILKALIESISLYPVGTYVQLNSGDVGQVIHVHTRLPLRPRVLLNLDRHGNPMTPRKVDLRTQPNLMVQRCMYEEGLASLKQAEQAQPAT